MCLWIWGAGWHQRDLESNKLPHGNKVTDLNPQIHLESLVRKLFLSLSLSYVHLISSHAQFQFFLKCWDFEIFISKNICCHPHTTKVSDIFTFVAQSIEENSTASYLSTNNCFTEIKFHTDFFFSSVERSSNKNNWQ